jgi:hypothetical protein
VTKERVVAVGGAVVLGVVVGLSILGLAFLEARVGNISWGVARFAVAAPVVCAIVFVWMVREE